MSFLVHITRMCTYFYIMPMQSDFTCKPLTASRHKNQKFARKIAWFWHYIEVWIRSQLSCLLTVSSAMARSHYLGIHLSHCLLRFGMTATLSTPSDSPLPISSSEAFHPVGGSSVYSPHLRRSMPFCRSEICELKFSNWNKSRNWLLDYFALQSRKLAPCFPEI